MAVHSASVRRATHHDFDAIAELMGGFMALHHRWHPEQFRTALLGFTAATFQGWLERQHELHLVAEAEGVVRGYACAWRWEDRGTDFTWMRRAAYIPFVVVASEQRRRGIGRALFAAVEAWAIEFEAEYVALNVSPRNESARAFYAALGYDVSSEYRAKVLRRVTRIEVPPPG